MSNEIPQDQLKQYLKGWRNIRHRLYRELLDSYTPEQKQIVRRMNHAAAQAALCVERLDSPNLRIKKPPIWPADPSQE